MPDEPTTTAPDSMGGGQTDPGPDGSQTTGADPSGPGGGQAGAADAGQTTDSGPDTSGQDSFFDPRDVPEELKPAYKQMQSAFTKKMQDISKDRQKIQAYDAFYQNPMEQIQRIAQQYGYQLTPAQAQAIANQQQGQNQQQGDQKWEPQSWDDVLAKAEERAEQRVLQKLQPVLGQVQTMRKQTIEQQLSEIDPTWQQYEDRMTDNLQTHPTLANDPAMLYRLSVPQEVLESRATQAALRKLEAKGQSANVSGSSTTNKQPGAGLPDKPVSFQEAVQAAQKELARKGLKPPG